MKNNISTLSENEITAIAGGNLIGIAGSFIGLGIFGELVRSNIAAGNLPASLPQRLLMLSAAGLATQVICSWSSNFVAAVTNKVFSKK